MYGGGKITKQKGQRFIIESLARVVVLEDFDANLWRALIHYKAV